MSKIKEESRAATGKPTVVSVEPELHQRLKVLAARQKRYLNRMVEEWLWERLRQEERKKPSP